MGAVGLIVNGHVTLAPSASYDVWVRALVGYTGDYLVKYEPLNYFKLGTFTTEFGVGNFHLNLMSADLPDGNYDIQVALNPLNNQGCTVVATTRFTEVTVHS